MRVKIKRSGSIFIGATVFLGVAAANTGNNLLYIVVSSMLAMMLISGLSSILNIKGLEIRLIPPPEVYAGRRIYFRVLARKSFPVPSFLIRISSGIDDTIFLIVDREWKESKLDISFPRRGKVDRMSITLSSDFPLGMFVRYREVEIELDLIVFPEPVSADFRLESVAEETERGSAERTLLKGYEEIKGIREYSGEPVKLIHWKVSAKRRELMVKEMIEEDKKPVMLSLDTVEGDMETKLSKLTYMVLKLMEEGYSVGLRLGNKEIPPGRGDHHKRLLLRELALY